MEISKYRTRRRSVCRRRRCPVPRQSWLIFVEMIRPSASPSTASSTSPLMDASYPIPTRCSSLCVKVKSMSNAFQVCSWRLLDLALRFCMTWMERSTSQWSRSTVDGFVVIVDQFQVGWSALFPGCAIPRICYSQDQLFPGSSIPRVRYSQDPLFWGPRLSRLDPIWVQTPFTGYPRTTHVRSPSPNTNP